MYYSLWKMLEMVDHSVNRKPCMKLFKENERLFKTVQGSTHNHQAWRGGYWDHVQETMNIAIVLHQTLDILRTLPFTLGTPLLVMSLHDVEKPLSYEFVAGDVCQRKIELATKQAQRMFRDQKLKEYGIQLLPEQINAMKYVEGEHDDYTNKKRVMNELAAFCH